MKSIKLIAFILVVIVFIASTYLFIEEKGTSDVGGAGGGLILIFVFIPMVISGIITGIVLLKSPRLYFFIFLGFIATLFLYLGVLKIIAMNKDRMIMIENTKEHEADKVLDKAWLLLESPTKADELLKTITNDTEQINERKAALYLALSLKDKAYKNSFTETISKTQKKGCHIINYLLENYKVSTEEELLSLFKVLENYDQVNNLNYCIPREQEADFTFEKNIEKKYFKAAIALLAFRELDFKKYYKKIDKIDNETYRKQAIITLLNQVDFYCQDWNDTCTITKLAPTVLALKDEKEFPQYVIILQQKLTLALHKKNTEDWHIYHNQQTQEAFMAMYQLLGAEHPLIQLIPKHISTFYFEQEKEILKYGKNNYILYCNFINQVEGNLEHFHAYTSEPYRIYRKGKLMHEGRSNQYGYISYKAYGAKADDLIQIETAPTGKWEQRVGWVSLLAPWDTYEGMQERNDEMGIYSSKGYTKERAKKTKRLFDAYMDDKWN